MGTSKANVVTALAVVVAVVAAQVSKVVPSMLTWQVAVQAMVGPVPPLVMVPVMIAP